MTVVTSGKVLVTGANGFVATWIVSYLLQKDYSVRAQVRSEEKGKHLKSQFGDKLEIIVVSDITAEGAFDDAVKGVDAVIHAASAFTFPDDPNDLIAPTVKAATGILQSTLEYGSSVRRVVLLASSAAVEERNDKPQTFDEKSWNFQAVRDVEANGKGAFWINKYYASKTLQEKASWDFYEKHKSSLGWDFVAINPSLIFGPLLTAVDKPEHLNVSMHELFSAVCKGEKDPATMLGFQNCWVDVRDVANAHVLALTKAEAAGERILVSAEPFNWYDWILVGRKISSEVPDIAGSYDPATTQYVVTFDCSKASRIFGLKYHTKEETLRDVFADVKSKGWW